VTIEQTREKKIVETVEYNHKSTMKIRNESNDNVVLNSPNREEND
jgi:hypothetical protein